MIPPVVTPGRPCTVGESSIVHRASWVFNGETACGQGGPMGGPLRASNRKITCPECNAAKRPPAKRRKTGRVAA